MEAVPERSGLIKNAPRTGLALCLRCDKPFCRHDARKYEAEPFTLAPVETKVGEALRLEALRVLGGRYRALLERSKEYAFSEIERQHMGALEEAIDSLTRMAPTAELLEEKGAIFPVGRTAAA